VAERAATVELNVSSEVCWTHVSEIVKPDTDEENVTEITLCGTRGS
jgi:hypothetical protein